MPTHMEGHEGNLLAGTQIQSLRVSSPLDGALESATCWLPFVLLCPSLCLLWAALTQLAGFA
jgi:ABC-type transport system involved in multi-copper enzyme maturation permease subunit